MDLEHEFIRLPSGALGMKRGLCLPVLYDEGGILAFNKPGGVFQDDHPWHHGAASIMAELRKVAAKDPLKVSMQRIECVRSLYYMGVDVSGVSLVAINAERAELLRNMYGSRQMELTFEFLAREQGEVEGLMECELPLAKHMRGKHEMVVSNKTGKKTHTGFVRLESYGGGLSLWEARIAYLREDQVELHAFEMGIPIVGEVRYGGQECVYLSELRGGRRRSEEQPAHRGALLHLKRVRFGEMEISAARPKAMNIVIKTLEG